MNCLSKDDQESIIRQMYEDYNTSITIRNAFESNFFNLYNNAFHGYFCTFVFEDGKVETWFAIDVHSEMDTHEDDWFLELVNMGEITWAGSS